MYTYEATPDVSAECPLEWVAGEKVELRVFNAAVLSREEDIDQAEHPALRTFARVWEILHDEERALRAARLWVTIFGSGEHVDVSHVNGYSQSDWRHIVCIGEDKAQVDSLMSAWGAWANGDVWVVTEKRHERCDMMHWHEVDSTSIGGIYAEDGDDAIDVHLKSEGGHHEWETAKFTGNKLCKRCNLLPLDQDDFDSVCHGMRGH